LGIGLGLGARYRARARAIVSRQYSLYARKYGRSAWVRVGARARARS
jgi:hypothetical protein